MTHLMVHGGPPGRHGPQRDACASGKGRNAPGGPPRATAGRIINAPWYESRHPRL